MKDIKHSKKTKNNTLDLREKTQERELRARISLSEPKITVIKNKKKNNFFFLIITLLVILLVVVGGFSYYYFYYLGKDSVSKTNNQRDFFEEAELREINDILDQLEEDIDKIDDQSGDEEVPQVDLNISL